MEEFSQVVFLKCALNTFSPREEMSESVGWTKATFA